MNSGYLYLETHTDYPGLVRVMSAQLEPEVPYDRDGSQIEYIARFDDLDTARLHLHNVLRHQLENIDFHTYRVSLIQAVAALEAEPLRHHRVWIAPHLAAGSLAEIEQLTDHIHRNLRRNERIWRVVGILGISWLLLLLILL